MGPKQYGTPDVDQEALGVSEELGGRTTAPHCATWGAGWRMGSCS